METARVDIRKLQLLNDRISQCLEALSQVRLSVHGLSHTGAQGLGMGQQTGFGQQAIPGLQGQGLQGLQGVQGLQGLQQGISPYGAYNPFANPFAQQFTPYGGLSHSQFGQQQSPFFGQQQIPFWAQQQTPFPPQTQGAFGGPQSWGQQTSGFGQQPFGMGMTGLSHSGIEQEALYQRPLWSDPLLAIRLRETFPYLNYALPPVISLF